MISVTCNLCGEKLDKPGALLFGYPESYREGCTITIKYHACVNCWDSKIQPLLTE